MSIYNNETKSYPDLNPAAPQAGRQTYRLKKLLEIEACFLDEIEICEQKAKKNKRSITILSIAETGLITSTMLTGGIPIAALASSVGLPIGIAFSGTSLLLSLKTPATRKYLKTSIVTQEKHDSIKLLAQGKLDCIANIISQVMQDGGISLTKLHRILQEKEKYLKLEAAINNQAMSKLKKIMKEQREKILEQGRKEREENFLQKIANTSGIQGIIAI